MGEETTWFDLLPGVRNLELFAKHFLARTQLGVQAFPSAFSITHVLAVLMVLAFVTIGAFAFRAAIAGGGKDAIVPPSKLTLRNLFEMFTDAVMGVAERRHGRGERAPLFAAHRHASPSSSSSRTCLALIPGFAPPTATLKTNVALALTVFVMTHVYGVTANGLGYFKQFLGHAPIYMAPLMIPIEIVSAPGAPAVAVACASSATSPPTTRSSSAFFVAGAADRAGAVPDPRRAGLDRPDARVLPVDDGLHPGCGGPRRARGRPRARRFTTSISEEMR